MPLLLHSRILTAVRPQMINRRGLHRGFKYAINRATIFEKLILWYLHTAVPRWMTTGEAVILHVIYHCVLTGINTSQIIPTKSHNSQEKGNAYYYFLFAKSEFKTTKKHLILFFGCKYQQPYLYSNAKTKQAITSKPAILSLHCSQQQFSWGKI